MPKNGLNPNVYSSAAIRHGDASCIVAILLWIGRNELTRTSFEHTLLGYEELWNLSGYMLVSVTGLGPRKKSSCPN